MNPTKIVFLKEVREMLRDKRVRSAAFFGPIFTMLLVVCGFGSILGGLGKTENEKLYVIKSSEPLPAFFDKLKFKVIPVESAEKADQMIKEGGINMAIEVVKSPGSGQIQLLAHVDTKQQKAQITLSRITKEVIEANRNALDTVLASKGIPPEVATPVVLVPVPVTVGEKSAGEFIVSMLPYLIVMWAFYGGFALASDLVAGEKEKATLETLLISPVQRTRIVLGKFLALAALCLASSLSSLLGLFAASVLKLPGSSFMLKDGLGISPTAGLVTFLVIVPTVAMFSSLLLAFSTYAKNPREAQTYIGLASFVVVIPAAFSQLIGLTDAGNQGWVNFVPVLNTANNIRNALLGKPDWMGVAITMAMSGLIAVILVTTVIKLFNREEVLTRV